MVNRMIRFTILHVEEYYLSRLKKLKTKRNLQSFINSNYDEILTTNFGYKKILWNEKEKRVKHVFQSVAPSYDVMNDIMSIGMHRLWKDELVSMMNLKGLPPWKRDEPIVLLDMAGGTGDVAFRLLDTLNYQKNSLKDVANITVCDINPHMLYMGKLRAQQRYGSELLKSGTLSFREVNAQNLTDIPNNSVDLYTIAFGLRNVTDIDKALIEAHRVLKPGGRYLCLEFSHVTSQILHALYHLYSFYLIPKFGEFIANDKESYQYLVESIRLFDTQEKLQSRMVKAGFIACQYTNLTSGIVSIHDGWKSMK